MSLELDPLPEINKDATEIEKALRLAHELIRLAIENDTYLAVGVRAAREIIARGVEGLSPLGVREYLIVAGNAIAEMILQKRIEAEVAAAFPAPVLVTSEVLPEPQLNAA